MRLLVASDLDGCLLDSHDYTWDAARDALAALRGAGAALVLASSKTLAEMEVLARELEPVLAPSALVVENGGALVLPAPDGGRARWSAGQRLVPGRPRDELAAVLGEIAREAGVRVRGFQALDAATVQALTGLGSEDARRALQREYDEPFLLDEPPSPGALQALAAAARARGLRTTRGGRFLHLTGAHDKGSTLQTLLEREAAAGRRWHVAALGDAPNDFPLLRVAHTPVIVPRPDGRPDPDLAAALPGAVRAPHPGPRGWNAAGLALLHPPEIGRREAVGA